MKFRCSLFSLLTGLGMWTGSFRAQPPATMSLSQAQDIAVRNHPRIASAALTAQAGEAAIKEVRRGQVPDPFGQCHRRWRGTWRGAFGRRRHHVQYL